MMKRIKILIVIAGFNFGVSGGVASTLYNYTRLLDEAKYQIDYLALGYQGFEPYQEELALRGSSFYCLDVTSHGWKRFYDTMSRLRTFLESHHDYDIIHCNSGAMRQVLMMALAARRGGCRHIIVHAHSAMRLSTQRKAVYGFVNHLFFICADVYLACSRMAAESMFPARILREGKWDYLPNGIESARFVYNPDIRIRVRHELGIGEDCYVVGHVGRFNAVKNHLFMIKVFAELQRRAPRSRLLLVGSGELMNDVRALARELGVDEYVLFTDQRKDVNDLIQAMDVFIFPSLYEGLGMSTIEAQASGIPIVASDRIPSETRVTDLIEYLPLGDAKQWSEKLLDVRNKHVRRDRSDEIREGGFEIHENVQYLDKIYCGMMQEE